MDIDKIINLAFEYRFEIIYVCLFIIGIIMNPSEFKARLYKSILEAKKLAKENVLKNGIEQENWVIDNLSKYIGIRFQPFVAILGEQNLRKIIKALYGKAIDLVDDGKLNDSLK